MEDNFNICFIRPRGFLAASYSGEWKVENIKKLIDGIKLATVKYDCNYVFLDAKEMPKPETEMIRFYSGEYIALMLPPPIKTAILGKKETINRFAETVAVNRGAIVQVFDKEKKALDWLMEK